MGDLTPGRSAYEIERLHVHQPAQLNAMHRLQISHCTRTDPGIIVAMNQELRSSCPGFSHMHKSRLGNIVIDCRTPDLLSAARFWSAALGYPLPGDLDATGNFIQLVTPPGEVQIIIQRVSHQARAHLDIETDSIESEVSRLKGLGAVVVSRNEGWVVMQAPSGHRFCVGSPFREGFEQGANTWQ